MPKAQRSTQQAKAADSAKSAGGSKQKREPNENPEERRERSLRACTRCRQRKQRCDNKLPNCTNCIKGGVTCEAFPLNVVSRENLLQLYDQLQERTRRNNAIQEELAMARLMVPDPLALFSALVAQQVACTVPSRSSQGGASNAFALPVYLNKSTHDTEQQSPMTPTNARQSQTPMKRACESLDLVCLVELLESSFPAVAPAIQFAVEHLEQKASSSPLSNLVELASWPIEEMVRCLSTKDSNGIDEEESEIDSRVKETACKLFAATDVTRVSATLLWTLLTIVKHRLEDLERLDGPLTYFMQTWQERDSPDAFVGLSVVPISFRRALDFVLLQTAILLKKICHPLSSGCQLDALDALGCKNSFATFLANCQIEQKRLEYMAMHTFSIPSASLSEAHHSEAVWSLLSNIRQLSERFEQGFETLGASSTGVSATQQALLKNKLGAQIYGMFARLLYIFGASERRHARWIGNATHLASNALSFYASAWTQAEWLGDHAVDALTFGDLLAAFVWAYGQFDVQQHRGHDWQGTIQAATELGERYANKWPLSSHTIRAALDHLRSFKDEPQICVLSTTSWPPVTSHTSSSSPAQASEVRTPYPTEPLAPYSSSLVPCELQSHWQDSQSRSWTAQACSPVLLPTSASLYAQAATHTTPWLANGAPDSQQAASYSPLPTPPPAHAQTARISEAATLLCYMPE